MITLLTLYFIGGLILSFVSLPLIFNKIKPNPFYGFRVNKTLTNPAIWYAVNKYAGRRLFYCGLAIMVLSIAFYFIPGISLDGYALTCLAAFLVCLGVTIYLSVRYLNNLGNL